MHSIQLNKPNKFFSWTYYLLTIFLLFFSACSDYNKESTNELESKISALDSSINALQERVVNLEEMIVPETWCLYEVIAIDPVAPCNILGLVVGSTICLSCSFPHLDNNFLCENYTRCTVSIAGGARCTVTVIRIQPECAECPEKGFQIINSVCGL